MSCGYTSTVAIVCLGMPASLYTRLLQIDMGCLLEALGARHRPPGTLAQVLDLRKSRDERLLLGHGAVQSRVAALLFGDPQQCVGQPLAYARGDRATFLRRGVRRGNARVHLPPQVRHRVRKKQCRGRELIGYVCGPTDGGARLQSRVPLVAPVEASHKLAAVQKLGECTTPRRVAPAPG